MIIGLLSLSASMASAQVVSYSTTGLHSSECTSDGWTQWTAEDSCDVPVTIDWNRETVTVEKDQTYEMLYQENAYVDDAGNEVTSYRIIDQHGDHGELFMVTDSKGESQLIIAFQDVRWCYDVTLSAPQDEDLMPSPMTQWMCMATP